MGGGVPVEAVAEKDIGRFQAPGQGDVDKGREGSFVAQLPVKEFGDEEVVVRLPHGGKAGEHHGQENRVEREGREDAGPGPCIPLFPHGASLTSKYGKFPCPSAC